MADGIPNGDAVGQDVVRDLYGLTDAGPDDISRISEAWRPYRMWAVVLLRVGRTRRQTVPVSYRRRCSAIRGNYLTISSYTRPMDLSHT